MARGAILGYQASIVLVGRMVHGWVQWRQMRKGGRLVEYGGHAGHQQDTHSVTYGHDCRLLKLQCFCMQVG
jgi:hypothetical protein